MKPQLSVIIPTRNRAEVLSRALESLTSQTIAATDFEVVIIDNGSTDTTAAVVANYQSRMPNLLYHFDNRPGLHVGRHAGASLSSGQILVYADDDIRAFPSWLEGVRESFRDETVALVGGKCLPDYEAEPPEWIGRVWYTCEWGVYSGYYSLIDFGDKMIEVPPIFIFGCNYSIRKQVLWDAGGFHPDGMPKNLLKYRGDGEDAVSKAIADMGLRAIYNPKASVYHLVSRERLCAEYIYERAFAQGISDSYTRVRAYGALSPLDFGLRAKQWRSRVHFVFGGDPIKKAMRIGYFDGISYHRSALRADKELLSWVLKPNYREGIWDG